MTVVSKQRQLNGKAEAIVRLKVLVTSDAEEFYRSDEVDEVEHEVAKARKVVNETSTLIEKGNTEEKEFPQKIDELHLENAAFMKEKTILIRSIRKSTNLGRHMTMCCLRVFAWIEQHMVTDLST